MKTGTFLVCRTHQPMAKGNFARAVSGQLNWLADNVHCVSDKHQFDDPGYYRSMGLHLRNIRPLASLFPQTARMDKRTSVPADS